MKKLENIPDRIYKYILECCEDGIPPTVREIGNALEIRSTSTVHKYLAVLENDGVIERGRGQGQNRNIRLAGDTVKRVPLVGTVAAGLPILAIEDIECYIPFKHNGAGEFFALHIQGESMIGAGIFNGDIIIVRKTEVIRDGEICVALIENEATVKRFYKKDGYFILKAENKLFEPIVTKELSILGKVVSLIREY